MNKLKYFFNCLLDYLWPQFCLGCKTEGSLCCSDCLAKLQFLPLDFQPWPEANNFSFDQCLVCLDYADPLIKKLIKNFKYNYLKNLNPLLANILATQIKKLQLKNIVISHAPLHKKKAKKRGFDQTQLLAQQVGENLQQPYLSLLTRIKNTTPQAELSRLERQVNVKDAFVINKFNQDKITGKTIILIDDVVTTGSTLHEAAKVLREFNPNKIIAVVLAKN